MVNGTILNSTTNVTTSITTKITTIVTENITDLSGGKLPPEISIFLFFTIIALVGGIWFTWLIFEAGAEGGE